MVLYCQVLNMLISINFVFQCCAYFRRCCGEPDEDAPPLDVKRRIKKVAFMRKKLSSKHIDDF